MKFTPLDLKNFNQLFEDKINAGYVLDFSNKTMREFFESELSIDIDNDIYRKDGDSKLKRLCSLIKQADRETVLRVVTRLGVRLENGNYPTLRLFFVQSGIDCT